ncbi:hypothetical protein RM550_26350 [Streptomyces sp. DSM 41527]|uniref:RING-type domain-containing protein n=1 Tax=Streptomyces mooreae TaxID=3075523 RepID=A0ABU2TE51_9ACTN|nr:hypothetical protein [Streptomyces sp. DSM 41527]MDT0459197.1 hypothetical protein [Streptomyces sp. DSM 41527]
MRDDGKDFHFPPLTNGLDFLVSAVTSLAAEGGPAPRELKYATLHLQSAAETLFKARLEMHKPELVWTKPTEYDEAKHQSGDFNSCGIKEAIKRLNALADEEEIIRLKATLDPANDDLKRLGDLRNRIMHFGWSDTIVAVQARTLPVLTLLFDFVHHDVLPYAADWEAERQMDEVRGQLKHLTDFVAQRQNSISDQLAGHEHSTTACRSCGQYAVVLDGGASDLECFFCGKAYGTGEEAAWEFTGEDRHSTIKQGGNGFATCPACAASAIVTVRTLGCPTADSYICFGCGSDWEGICEWCGSGGYIVLDADMCDDCYEIRYDNF